MILYKLTFTMVLITLVVVYAGALIDTPYRGNPLTTIAGLLTLTTIAGLLTLTTVVLVVSSSLVFIWSL